MGYRSEVVLVVGKEIIPQFMVTMAKSLAARAMCFDEATRVKDYEGEEGAILFRWDSIKWYDSFEEVEAIEDFMDWCECEELELDDGIHSAMDFFRFVRIGEEMDDVVERGMGFWSVGVRRAISW